MNLWLPKERWGKDDLDYGISRLNSIYKTDKKQGFTVHKHRNCIQYLTITYHGK